MNCELNPFEIKAEINKIFSELKNIDDAENYEVHYRVLDAQSDKNIIVKLLFKEINRDNPKLLKFLLLRYCPKAELAEKLWELIKNNLTSNQTKIFALDLLRDIDTNWTYENCSQYLDNADELVDADTKRILDTAIFNPEVQIDFLDFLHSISEKDQIVLIKSLADDYSKDELANMLIPVFLSEPYSQTGKTALEILGESKSQLAYHALNSSLSLLNADLHPAINKNISLLKLAGIREDNSHMFYAHILKNSRPFKFCITYPDGHGNQAIIFSRINNQKKVQFVAVVRDCFGFNEISEFECNTIITRFFRGQRAVQIEPAILKSILQNAEKLSVNKLPYEYICWRSLLADIEPSAPDLPYKPTKLSPAEFEDILKSDFTDFWFLNSDYSDEFEEFLKLADNTAPEDFDKIIDDNINKIFYDTEKSVWTKRILNVSILKHISGEEKTAQNLYSLYNDEILINELFKNIVRKSLYEYYFAKNDKQRIKSIEDMWVK